VSGWPQEFAECLAVVLGGPDAATAGPDPDEDPAAFWRQWLATRNLGLVPIADPTGFSWAGYWLAFVRGGSGGTHAVLMFGVPSGPVLDPSGILAEDPGARIEQGLLVAPLELHFPPGDPYRNDGRGTGTVEAVMISPEATAPLRKVAEARAVPGRGLEGDRYWDGRGTFAGRRGFDLTLIEAEALEALAADGNVELAWEEARRNLVTRGIDLNSLVGRSFRVGEVECVGRRLAEPCAHLERLSRPGVIRGLVHRAGLRADILTDGVIRPGDAVAAQRLPG